MTWDIKDGWVTGDLYGTKVEKMEGPRPGGQAYIRFAVTPRCFVYHTTEGFTVSGAVATLRAKFAAPHFVTGEGRIVQMRPLWAQAATLRDEDWPGSFHPNAHAFQIETVDRTKMVPWLPAEPTQEPTAKVMAFVHEYADVPLVHADTTLPRGDVYPKVPGFYGHIDIQENTHNDPGALKWAEMFARAEDYVMDPKYQKLLDALLEMPKKEGDGTADPQYIGKRIVDGTLLTEKDYPNHGHVTKANKPTGPPVPSG